MSERLLEGIFANLLVKSMYLISMVEWDVRGYNVDASVLIWHGNHVDVEKCQTEGFDWQNLIGTDKILIFLLHILLFGLTRFSKSVEMTAMSKKISTSLEPYFIMGISVQEQSLPFLLKKLIWIYLYKRKIFSFIFVKYEEIYRKL